MSEQKLGRVYLVGAGCGSADLITLRGKRLLEQCDAVVYDDLIDPSLLDLAPIGAEWRYLGKRCGKHSAPQGDISAALIAMAQAGKTVVRLKGGDPFVFGRGGEELLALNRAGVPCEEVPGITSAVAIPAGAGIPVTHRGLSRSFHVITGHTAHTPDGLPENFAALARCGGTLVFLMGLGHLEVIARRLMEEGRAPDTPVAVVSGGNSAHPADVRGTLADIAQLAQDVQAPAVIVVGEVAALHLTQGEGRPLAGLRVGCAGTGELVRAQRELLEPLGAQVIWTARLGLEPLEPPELRPLLEEDRPQWLVFTSARGVERFFCLLGQYRLDLRRLGKCKLAAIGPATGRALEDRGLYPQVCPSGRTGEALAQTLVETVRHAERVLLLRSAQGSPKLAQALRAAGLEVRDLALYTAKALPGPEPLPELDVLTFGSAGGVGAFVEQYGPVNIPAIAIGPVTARALERAGMPGQTAPEISAQGLAQAVGKWAEEK